MWIQNKKDHAYDAVRYMCGTACEVKPEKPFNDGYRYEDDNEGDISAWGV